MAVIISILAIGGQVVIRNGYVTGILLAIAIALLGIHIISKQKQKSKKKEEKQSKSREIQHLEEQIQILEKEEKDHQKEIDKIEQTVKEEEEQKKLKLKQTYSTDIDLQDIDYIINKKEITYELEEQEKQYQEERINLHRLEIEKENWLPKLDTLAKIEEEIMALEEQKQDLEEKAFVINKTKEMLEKAYHKMKNSVTPKFTNQLSQNIAKIANGKYKNVRFNDTDGLVVELANGDYITAERLSVGTIDQLYLALRLAVLEELTQETLPIILDESFAYYDTERLENLLTYMSQELKEKQILILTCTNREEEILNRLQIEHQYIEL